MTGRAWLTSTPVCSTCHHRYAGTGCVRAVRGEKEMQDSCFLPQEAKQARGVVAVDRENSTYSGRSWPGLQAWGAKPPALLTTLCVDSAGMRWGDKGHRSPSKPWGYQDPQHGGRKDTLTFRKILPPQL